MNVLIREAKADDLGAIREIYNQGIHDRIATLETEEKDYLYMKEWFEKHSGRFQVIVAEKDGKIIGWASLNQYNNRCAYDGVADISVYISRDFRGKGVGNKLLAELESIARVNNFHKMVLFTFPFNQLGQGLYKKTGFREVGIFQNQGILDGKFVDVMAMEKLL
ncbi:arsinothricin resistance N-acetyltransferase ArsN1 family A [Bacillus sp. FJAT-29814]|uniref:arsinothricin resistance N-acetyltransferase ArsN1 family A n=1 Tax=Bacillus sp. FJAT-29814 TaxID=1729688 RepID=UPI00082F3080|nr:arsinothricin resistance N-acetyltransferase ArsN1 family A [Bacillus sp. FJAT-29814]